MYRSIAKFFLLLVPCTYREKCTFGEWSSWEGYIKAGTPGCYKQTRTKPYEYPLQTRMRRFSCRGLNINCNRPPVEERMQCKFSFCHVFESNMSCFDHAKENCHGETGTVVIPSSNCKTSCSLWIDFDSSGPDSTLFRRIPCY